MKNKKFVNKQLMLPFNYLKNSPLNFAQNFRKCSFNPDDQKSVEKSKRAEFFAYISQLFVYKIYIWTQLRTCSRYRNVRPVYTFVLISRSFQTLVFFSEASGLLIFIHKCKKKIIRQFHTPSTFTFMTCKELKNILVIGNFKKLDQ